MGTLLAELFARTLSHMNVPVIRLNVPVTRLELVYWFAGFMVFVDFLLWLTLL